MRVLYKALSISLLVHLAVIISLVVFPFLKTEEHIPVIQVSLVPLPEPEEKEPVVEPKKEKPAEKKPPEKKEEPAPVEEKPKPVEKKPKPVEKKPKPVQKKPEKKEVVKKKDVKKKPEVKKDQSLKRVQQKIDDLKKKMSSQANAEAEYQRTARVAETKKHAYFNAIATRIQANWSLLKNQMEDVGTLTTDVGLQIRRDGTIESIFVEKSSGDPLFDEFAIRAVKRSAPLPSFPKEVKESKLEVTIGLSS
jgi:TonB family protein